MKDNKIKNLWIGIDSYEYRPGYEYGSDCIVMEIDGISHKLPINIYPQILNLDKHDRAIKEGLLNDLRKLAQADSRTVEHLFGKYAIGYVLRDCSTEEILSGVNKFSNRKNRLKDLLEQNDFSMEEAKRLLED